MRFVWSSAVKDLRRLRREPTTLLIWLGIPTFVALILTLIFGRGPTRPHGVLLIADEDGGFAATVLSGAFSQGALGEMITVEKINREEGRKRMDKGNGSALLIIPKGFTTAVFQSTPTKLELVRNPAQRILPGMIEETLSMLTDGAFYLQTVAGDQLRGIARSGPPTDAGVASTAMQINQLIGRLRKYLGPPLIQLETKVIKSQWDQPGAFAAVLFPSMLYMAIFFIAGGLAVDVWRERTAGSLRRVATTPVTLAAFLAGKLLATELVLVVIAVFGLLLGQLLIDLRIANFAIAALWIAASGSGLYLLMMLVQSMATSERVANLLSNVITLPLAMLGGSFFPFESMPAGMARIGRWTPNGWSLTQLRAILAGSLHWTAVAGVTGFILLAWIAVVWRVRRTPC